MSRLIFILALLTGISLHAEEGFVDLLTERI